MKILAIAINTGREAIRNKVLYSILLFACLLTGISAAFGAVSIGDTIKLVKDFSLFSISIFGVTTAVVLGVTLLSRELGKRTIYNILSKPVARWEFLLGKFLGLLTTLAPASSHRSREAAPSGLRRCAAAIERCDLPSPGIPVMAAGSGARRTASGRCEVVLG